LIANSKRGIVRQQFSADLGKKVVMLRFISRRLVFIALIAVLIIFFAYLGMSMVPNSEAYEPNYNLLEHGMSAWRETRAFLAGRNPLSAPDLLLGAYVNSMGLVLVALVTAAALGLCIGAVTALTKRRWLIMPLLALTIVGISVPSFFAGLLLRLGELKYLDIFGQRLVRMAGFGWDFQHMLMPVLVLAAWPLAYLTRASFISLSRAMEEDYIRTAYAKGLTVPRTVSDHAFRNVAIPVLTALGVSIRFSLSALPIVEFFFVWPGMGVRLLQAISQRQATVVVALALALGLTILFVNLGLDILYRMVDPRMRDA
jgi:ABC-type dipeptide/oligopeptide/nickel transport system permease component